MSLRVGIVGLPNVGKSTIFQAITKKQIDCSNYPFCTIDPNIGTVAVPDERVDKLAEITSSAKKIYATVEFVDIAGLVKGASKGEGLGNKFLANIREVDAVVYVLRAFQNENVINTQSEIDILRDKDVLDTEMALKDLETVDKRIHGLDKETRTGDKEAIKELEVLKKAQGYLQEGKVLSEIDWIDEEQRILNGYQLLTSKPKLYLLNGQESEVAVGVVDAFKKNNWSFLIIDILSESEGLDLKPEERETVGLSGELKLDSLIQEAYKLLDLITFFTTGPDETRAWTLKKGKMAPQAGGVIHSDFEQNFIKASVISSYDLINSGGFAQAREKGLIRTEGKEYIIKDNDVIEIKSNA